MGLLTRIQKSELIGIIRDEFGSDLSREEFIDVTLQLFEDISGFETASEDETLDLTEQLWGKYNE